MTTPNLHNAKRIVIKIGSLLLANAESGDIWRDWLASLATDIAALKDRGIDVIVVSSGAITLGRNVLKLHHNDLRLEEKQAAAACGQIRLIEAWQAAFKAHEISVAQILITTEDTENRRRYLNARATLSTLLEAGIVPIINENDSITTKEIRYGDNDRLAAHVAAVAGADTLLLLSDIDGLYNADPRQNNEAEFIPVINQITAQIQAMAGDASDHFSSGGMKTKVQAAQIATSAGCHMAVVKGTGNHPIQALLDGGRCSWFMARQTPLNARKHWIANAIQHRGSVTVDAGAAKALSAGKSLLPAGVIAIDGTFDLGDAVDIKQSDGTIIGAGLIAYPYHEAKQIMGKRSDEIKTVLGYKRRDALIHRDDLVAL